MLADRIVSDAKAQTGRQIIISKTTRIKAKHLTPFLTIISEHYDVTISELNVITVE